jgi:hypothetical protein
MENKKIDMLTEFQSYYLSEKLGLNANEQKKPDVLSKDSIIMDSITTFDQKK